MTGGPGDVRLPPPRPFAEDSRARSCVGDQRVGGSSRGGSVGFCTGGSDASRASHGRPSLVWRVSQWRGKPHHSRWARHTHEARRKSGWPGEVNHLGSRGLVTAAAAGTRRRLAVHSSQPTHDVLALLFSVSGGTAIYARPLRSHTRRLQRLAEEFGEWSRALAAGRFHPLWPCRSMSDRTKLDRRVNIRAYKGLSGLLLTGRRCV